jgi:hypothetical protein
MISSIGSAHAASDKPNLSFIAIIEVLPSISITV